GPVLTPIHSLRSCPSPCHLVILTSATVYQSDPRTLPSYGWQALYQVRVATEGLTERTLPSPRPTIMALVCGDCVTFCWQLSGPGGGWNGMAVPGAPA